MTYKTALGKLFCKKVNYTLYGTPIGPLDHNKKIFIELCSKRALSWAQVKLQLAVFVCKQKQKHEFFQEIFDGKLKD